MKPVNQKAQTVIRYLAKQATANGGNVKIDNTDGRFMPVHVEHIGNGCLSIAHYGEQNGDAMRDPDMVFWLGADGNWYPVSYRNDYAGIDREAVIEWAGDRPLKYRPKEQAQQAAFAGLWMMNIKDQQGLNLSRMTAEVPA
jgi:hypothetical protein